MRKGGLLQQTPLKNKLIGHLKKTVGEQCNEVKHSHTIIYTPADTFDLLRLLFMMKTPGLTSVFTFKIKYSL